MVHHRKVAVIALALLVSGCSTVNTRTATLCDAQITKFWFIPLTKQESCIAISGGNSDGTLIPVQTQPE